MPKYGKASVRCSARANSALKIASIKETRLASLLKTQSSLVRALSALDHYATSGLRVASQTVGFIDDTLASAIDEVEYFCEYVKCQVEYAAAVELCIDLIYKLGKAAIDLLESAATCPSHFLYKAHLHQYEMLVSDFLKWKRGRTK